MNVYGMVILTILCTGMRVSEAVDLRLDDIDREQATLRVDSSYSRVIHGSKAPKTANSYRTVPVPAFLINRLNQWRFRQNEVLMNKGKEASPGKEQLLLQKGKQSTFKPQKAAKPKRTETVML